MGMFRAIPVTTGRRWSSPPSGDADSGRHRYLSPPFPVPDRKNSTIIFWFFRRDPVLSLSCLPEGGSAKAAWCCNRARRPLSPGTRWLDMSVSNNGNGAQSRRILLINCADGSLKPLMSSRGAVAGGESGSGVDSAVFEINQLRISQGFTPFAPDEGHILVLKKHLKNFRYIILLLLKWRRRIRY